jgi:transposase
MLMATIQARVSRGQKYWYIIESRRVNGKPRPIVLAYLGKADNLLKRLQGFTDGIRLKSYSHGGIAATLDVANQLDICTIINKHVKSTREYRPTKPISNHLTVGATLLLAALGRICMPTSKRGWWDWAKTTSLEYLLKCSLSKLDSQHFWDMMDAVPIDAIEKIEEELLKKVFALYQLEQENLFYDTTNFFTYINTANERCTIAKRGKNKQKRTDLRQVGLALVVTQQDKIPLFHLTYQGNINDSKVFNDIVSKLRNRMEQLKLQQNEHTIVFDRGNNSKQNMQLVKKSQFHYVGALTPHHHQSLVEDSLKYFIANEKAIYRDKRVIWDEERTIIIYISEQLKTGQIRGIKQTLEKKEKKLKRLQETLASPKRKRYERSALEAKIINMLRGQHVRQLVQWTLTRENEILEISWFSFFNLAIFSKDFNWEIILIAFLTENYNRQYNLNFVINQNKLREIEERCGLRILMTDRHAWSSEKIISAYEGQAEVESAFKNMKNPYHLTLKPQFHWTDQKIIVHYFVCIIGYLLSTLLWREAKIKTEFGAMTAKVGWIL